MGTTKQLLPFKGRTILETVVDNALRSSLDQVVVVLIDDVVTTGATLTEAAACGTPTVASDSPGLKEPDETLRAFRVISARAVPEKTRI